MTKMFIGSRGNGKTATMIRHSAETGVYILVTTRKRADQVFKQASEMGLRIPFPVTVEELKRSGGFNRSSIRRDGLYIDNIDDVLRYMFNGIEIKEFTLNKDNFNLELTYLDDFRECKV